jgi:hypothetical protein
MKTQTEKTKTAQQLRFSPEQIEIVTDATEMAEELVSDHYKMSASQWLRSVYDIKTLADLTPDEIVQGAYAQIIRYEGKPQKGALGSSTFDFYKICIQDHSILSTLEDAPDIKLSPFSLYIVTHELIHVVRFKKFLQNFSASPQETMNEEKRVHDTTRDILRKTCVPGLGDVLSFYRKWHSPIENRRNP